MKSLLLQLTGEMPLFKILDFLVDNKGADFTKKEIAEGAGISRASLFNYWNEIDKHNIVRTTRSFGKTRLYTLNTDSIITRRILDLERALISEALSKERIDIVKPISAWFYQYERPLYIHIGNIRTGMNMSKFEDKNLFRKNVHEKTLCRREDLESYLLSSVKELNPSKNKKKSLKML